MFDDKMLERLIEIEKCGSFSKAAEELFISRQALLQQVSLIEKDLNFEIFYRTPKGVTLTEAGELFLRQIQQFSKNYNQIISACRQISEGREKIVIGSLPNFYSIIFPELVREFKKIFPQVEIEFKDFFAKKYFKHLLEGDFDVSIEHTRGYYGCNKPEFEFIELEDTFHACAVLNSNELSQKTIINYKDLRNRKILMFEPYITRADDELHRYINKYEPEIEIIKIAEYDSNLAIKCEIENAAIIHYAGYESSFPNFISIPTNFKIPIKRGIGYRKDSRNIVKEFAEITKKYLKSKKY